MSWGAGPRAVQYLILGAKARAALLGSYMVRLEDVQEAAVPVLTHRIITTFAAQAEGIDAKKIVRRLVEETDMELSRGHGPLAAAVSPSAEELRPPQLTGDNGRESRTTNKGPRTKD